MSDVTDPVVLVPGLFGSPRLFQEQIPELWKLGSVHLAGRLEQGSMAALAGAVLDAAPRRFALVGLSLGGYVAFEILRQAPERVSRVALLSTSARPDTPEQSERRGQQVRMAASGRFAEIPELAFPLLVHPSRQGDARLRECVRAMAVDTGPEVFARQQEATIGRADSRPLLESVDCPVLVMSGDEDRLIPPEHSDEIAAGVPRSSRVVVPECGHLSTVERPVETSRALVSWLRAG